MSQLTSNATLGSQPSAILQSYFTLPPQVPTRVLLPPLWLAVHVQAEGVCGSNLYAQIYESHCWLNELLQSNELIDSLYLTFMWLLQKPAWKAEINEGDKISIQFVLNVQVGVWCMPVSDIFYVLRWILYLLIKGGEQHQWDTICQTLRETLGKCSHPLRASFQPDPLHILISTSACIFKLPRGGPIYQFLS